MICNSDQLISFLEKYRGYDISESERDLEICLISKSGGPRFYIDLESREIYYYLPSNAEAKKCFEHAKETYKNTDDKKEVKSFSYELLSDCTGKVKIVKRIRHKVSEEELEIFLNTVSGLRESDLQEIMSLYADKF